MRGRQGRGGGRGRWARLGAELLWLLALGALLARAPARAEEEGRPLAALRRALGDPDRGVRYAAVIALGKAGAGPEILAPALSDRHWCVRQEAAWWIRAHGVAAAPVLGAALRSARAEVRASAAWACSALGAEGVALLAAALRDADPGVRLEALRAAVRLGTREGGLVLAPLTEALARFLATGSEEEQDAAAHALVHANREHDAAVAAHLSDRLVRSGETTHGPAAAARTLVRLGARGRAVLTDLRGEPRRRLDRAIEALEHTSRPVPPPQPFLRALAPAPSFEAKPRPPAPAAGAGVQELLASAGTADLLARCEAWLALGRAGADAAAFTPAFSARDADERAAAALALGGATGAAAEALHARLEDPNWRVRQAALRALTQRGDASGRVVALLEDPSVALMRAAFEALAAAREPAALAVAEALERGHYGLVHFAARLFERWGPAGAPAVARLAGLLAHSDVNVRECAARCLRSIGPAARGAAEALVAALGDRRLCVVAHAALALGATGAEEPIVRALADPRARVRAYAAYALGWMHGTRRGLWQEPYEPRLPVLDLGGRSREAPGRLPAPAPDGPGAPAEVAALRACLWSADPVVAVGAAARLSYEALDAEETERVMEVLLPEGQRAGGPADFDELRSMLGSSEVPAFVQYVLRASVCEPGRESVYGHLHRLARKEHLSWLAYVHATEEVEAQDGIADLWMPAGYSAAALRERLAVFLGADPGPRPGDPAREVARAWRADPARADAGPEAWALSDLEPGPGDAAALRATLAAVGSGRGDGVRPEPLWALLRALGRADDPDSAPALGARARQRDVAGNLAAAALARRGVDLAVALLAERARGDATAWFALADARPLAAARCLAELVGEPEGLPRVIRFFGDYVDPGVFLGTRLPPEALCGVPAAVAHGDAPFDALAEAALAIPGAGTLVLADQLLARLEEGAARPFLTGEDAWAEIEAERLLSFLHAARPERLKALLRTWAEPAEAEDAWRRLALFALARLGEADVAGALLDFFEARGQYDAELLRTIDGPATRAWLAARSLNGALSRAERQEALEDLAWLQSEPPERVSLDEFDPDARGQVAAWIRAGRMDLVREARALAAGEGAPPPPVWRRLAERMRAGDAHARAELWSALRAGRYRWFHGHFEARWHALGPDWATYPHWIEDLDSNCCRVSDGLAEELFEQALGLGPLYGTERNGFGRPLSERVWEWFSLFGGELVWCPLLERYVPRPR